MKTSELREMSDEQLDLTLKETEHNLFRLRMQAQTERLQTRLEPLLPVVSGLRQHHEQMFGGGDGQVSWQARQGGVVQLGTASLGHIVRLARVCPFAQGASGPAGAARNRGVRAPKRRSVRRSSCYRGRLLSPMR